MNSYFVYKGKAYSYGTIAKIYDYKINKVEYCRYLVFWGKNKNGEYIFYPKDGDMLKKQILKEYELEKFIECIVRSEPLELKTSGKKVPLNYIDGAETAIGIAGIIIIGAIFIDNVFLKILIIGLTIKCFNEWHDKKSKGE